jgi:1-pyrroline-5-carboxylate dehydrogenase
MSTLTKTITPFVNEPFTNFTKEENKQAMQAALAKVKKELGQEIPLHIGMWMK